jgi:hypothetical protein
MCFDQSPRASFTRILASMYRKSLAPLAACLLVSSMAVAQAKKKPTEDSEAVLRAKLSQIAPWVGRSFSTGQVLKPERLRMNTLAIADGLARLTIEEQERQANGPGLPFVQTSLETYEGRIEIVAPVIRLNFETTPKKFTLLCSFVFESVAKATAVRVPDPNYRDECGNEGVWFPRKTKRIQVLHCQRDIRLGESYAFAALPGVEDLSVNDDCTMQGGGYRAISEDGSVKPVRRADD